MLPHAGRIPSVLGDSDETEDVTALVCAECGAVSDPDAAGWRAYLDVDGEAVVFCPECAERVRLDRGSVSCGSVLLHPPNQQEGKGGKR